MRRFTGFCILFWLALNVFAQENQVLVTIGNKEFMKDEFERIYRKNNTNLLEVSDKKTPEEYLGLFINFKLKVMEAESLKMDTAQAFISELSGYRKELAAPYLTDVSFNKKMVEELYQRMKTEVRAGHLLITLASDLPEDTLAAYNKIMSVREKIINGLDFPEAAYEYSEDPTAKSNRGDLGYFSAFQMVAPFEDAAFNTPVRSISMPIRTSFGYHLIYVYDKREALGEIRVAHIMKSFPQEVTETVMRKLKSETDSIYKLLKKGANFAEMAKKCSDDKRSAENGGILAWFSPGRMIAEFSNAAFALKFNGDITEPVLTQFGYHIIRQLDRRGIKSFEDSEKEIENRVKADPERSVHSKVAFINKLKNEYNFKVNETVASEIKNNKYPLSPEGVSSKANSAELAEINGTKLTAGQFINFMARRYPEIKEFAGGAFSTYFNEWVETELTAYEDSRLEEKYPDFKYLMQEYHDGILLFNVSDEKIWSYAVNDSAGLLSYYEKNKGAYNWGERFKGLIVTCRDQETREDVEKYFAAGMGKQEIQDLVNSNGERVKFEEGAWEENANPIVNYYVWNGGKPENFDETLVFIHGDKVGPEPKLLNEAKGLYLSDYQSFLEKQWVNGLRAKYKIKVNRKLLKTIGDASN